MALTAAAVGEVLAARSVSLEAGTRALAAAAGIVIGEEGGRAWMPPRDEVLLELLVDAMEAGRDAGLGAAKLAIFIDIHQRLAAALASGLVGGALSASAPVLPAAVEVAAAPVPAPAPPAPAAAAAAPLTGRSSATKGGRPTAGAATGAAAGAASASPAVAAPPPEGAVQLSGGVTVPPLLRSSATASGALQTLAQRASGPTITTSVEAVEMFDTYMRAHVATSFTDPEAATSRFTVAELATLAGYVRDRGFLKHFLLYRNAFTLPERHRVEARNLVVDAPLPVPPLAAAQLVPSPPPSS